MAVIFAIALEERDRTTKGAAEGPRGAPVRVVEAVEAEAARARRFSNAVNVVEDRDMHLKDAEDLSRLACLLANGDAEAAVDLGMTVVTDVRERIPRIAWIWMECATGETFLAQRPTEDEVEAAVG